MKGTSRYRHVLVSSILSSCLLQNEAKACLQRIWQLCRTRGTKLNAEWAHSTQSMEILTGAQTAPHTSQQKCFCHWTRKGKGTLERVMTDRPTVTVLYRSKDGTLPDFSQVKGAGGEVFFDVSFTVYHMTARLNVHCSLTRSLPTGQLPSQRLPLHGQASISLTVFPSR